MGITSPTGVLGVVESKAWGLGQMAFRKLRRGPPPYLPVPPAHCPCGEGTVCIKGTSGGAGPHNLSPLFTHPALLEGGDGGPRALSVVLGQLEGAENSKFSKTLILIFQLQSSEWSTPCSLQSARNTYKKHFMEHTLSPAKLDLSTPSSVSRVRSIHPLLLHRGK